jgi:hypothetical protein
MANQSEMKGVISGLRMTAVDQGMARHLMKDIVIINGIPDISSIHLSKGILILTDDSLPDLFIWEDMFSDDQPLPDDTSVFLDDSNQDILQMPWPNVNQDPILGR